MYRECKPNDNVQDEEATGSTQPVYSGVLHAWKLRVDRPFVSDNREALKAQAQVSVAEFKRGDSREYAPLWPQGT